MAGTAFKTAMQRKPWWFTHDEVRQIDSIRHSFSRPSQSWVMQDATPSQIIDAISMTAAGGRCVCISKRMDVETGRPVYDITSKNTATKTIRSFTAAKTELGSALLRNKLDLLWERIADRLPTQSPSL